MGHRQVTIMKVVLLASSVASLVVLASAAYQEHFRGDWREAQGEYRKLLLTTAPTEAARHAALSFAIGHKQLYLPKLSGIDRCTTCHLGVENPAMAGVNQPLGLHPDRLLSQHPPEKFGCTICHQGEGRATTKEAAHGWQTRWGARTVDANVDKPLLLGDTVYTSCGRCHHEIDLFGGESDLFAGSTVEEAAAARIPPISESSLDRALPGAHSLAEGKRLVVQLGCLGCHKYRGRGGILGPPLTYVGDKTRHDFDFRYVKGEHTVEQWLYEHFMFPGEVSPGTMMAEMGLSSDEARSLTLYMMSLHRKTAPASHIPRPVLEFGSGEAVRGETLYRMFCSSCHGADGFGTTMRAGLWPMDADPWGHDWDARDVVVERRSELEVMVPSLNHSDTLATVSDDYLRRIIAHGRPDTHMISWLDEGGLTPDEITLLVNHIRNWDSPVPALIDVAAARGDPGVGTALYRANCAACHGRKGEGGIGNALNSPTFLAVASDAFLSSTIAFGRPNTAMPAWRDFNGQEISDLLAFIRQWQPQRSTLEGSLALAADTETDTVSSAIGGILYKANCVTCHGAEGAGDLGPTLNTQAFLTLVDDAFLIETLVSGRPGTGMPSWRHLSNDDVASIVRFIRTWQTEPSRQAAWHQQAVPRGDWDAGRHLFAGHCAGCHGPEAEGAIGPQLGNPVFLRTTSNVMLREWIKHGKEGTPMLGFRKGGQGITELSERQIEDIVAYLRLLERTAAAGGTKVAKSPYGRPEKGAAVYVHNCSGCHGERGEGSSGPALSNPNFLRFASDGFLMATMALGRSGTEMRPVKRGPQSILGLSSDEVNDLVAYLRSWEHDSPFAAEGGPEIPHRFVIPWSLERGGDLFASFCAGCHGVQGKGLWAPELNNEGFLAAASDGFLQATIVRGRHGTAMRPFGIGGQGVADLTADDIDNIVAYMRQWSASAPSLTVTATRPSRSPGYGQTEQEQMATTVERPHALASSD